MTWLVSLNILPTVEVANQSVRYNNFDMLEYLEHLNIFPNSTGANTVLTDYGLDMLLWIKSKGYLSPTI